MKHVFRSFAAVLTTTLIVGWNGFLVVADESPGAQASDEYIDEYDDSGGESDVGNPEDANDATKTEDDVGSREDVNNVTETEDDVGSPEEANDVTETEDDVGSEEPDKNVSPTETVDDDISEPEGGTETGTSDEIASDMPETETSDDDYSTMPEMEPESETETDESTTSDMPETEPESDMGLEEIESSDEVSDNVSETELESELDTEETKSADELIENCICESRCGPENVFTDCAVCMENYSNCTGAFNEETADADIPERVARICAMIDSLPTVQELYKDVPNETAESFVSWVLELENVLKKAEEIQEQYNALSAEEQSLVGNDRKLKLDELCGLAETTLEMIELYDTDNKFTENGITYKIIQDNQVAIVRVSDAILNSSLIIDEVEHDGKKFYVTQISDYVFASCDMLESIEISYSVTYIGEYAFGGCKNLKTVGLPAGITICDDAFQYCSSLNKIIIKGSEVREINIIGNDVFYGCPGDRNIVFILADGTELTNSTTPTLKEAVTAYMAVDDGNTTDDLWYGWKLPELLYNVEIQVRKDDVSWEGHNRIFGLKADGSDDLITDLHAVRDGTYILYDITESSSGVATGITIKVEGGDANCDVDYYTVTFYDGDRPYRADTLQPPQIVLKGQTCSVPPDPQKEGYMFIQWVTEKDGQQSFDFGGTKIAVKTDIYASWIQIYTITASAEGDGRISPKGEIPVKAGENMTFTFEPGEGSHIKEVIVNDESISIEGDTSYTFENVNGDCTIKVIFESDASDMPGGDEPGGDTPGGDEPGGDTPGGDEPGGDEPGGDTPGGDEPGGDTPGGDEPGGDNPGGDTPGGDNPGGDNPGGDTPGGGEDKPGTGEDKPGTGEKPGTGQNTSQSSSNSPNHSSNNSSSNNSSSNSPTTANIVPLNTSTLITAYNDISEHITDTSTTEIVPDNTDERSVTDSLKDDEPVTGDESSIVMYVILIMAAGIALWLFEFIERKRHWILIYSNRKHNTKKH